MNHVISKKKKIENVENCEQSLTVRACKHIISGIPIT